MIPGHATPEATAAFKARFDGRAAPDHFSLHRDLQFSSIGLGTYLGDSDDATDEAYHNAIVAAAERGCNVIDTAINYRCQRSERAVGRALRTLLDRGFRREEFLICTKGGYLAFDGAAPEHPARWFQDTFVKPGIAAFDDISAGSHCMTPRYLDHEIERSRRNLGLDCIDVYFIHNPETELVELSEEEFVGRMTRSFACLEAAAKAGRIGWYGTSTWEGFRSHPQAVEYLPLPALAQIAESVGGTGHHFRFIQLPFNLGMAEGWGLSNQIVERKPCSTLAAAAHFGLTAMGSAALGQGRAARGLPAAASERVPGCATDAQRAIQFARSAPGLATALVGMRRVEHVAENLAVAAMPKLPREAFEGLFRKNDQESIAQ